MWVPGPKKDLDAGVIAASSSTQFLVHFIYRKVPPSRYVIFLWLLYQIWGVSATDFSNIFTPPTSPGIPTTQMLNLLLLSYRSLRLNSLFKIYFPLSFELDNFYWSIFQVHGFLPLTYPIYQYYWAHPVGILFISFSVLKRPLNSFLYLYFLLIFLFFICFKSLSNCFLKHFYESCFPYQIIPTSISPQYWWLLIVFFHLSWDFPGCW